MFLILKGKVILLFKLKSITHLFLNLKILLMSFMIILNAFLTHPVQLLLLLDRLISYLTMK
jgi:hypothetical protein